MASSLSTSSTVTSSLSDEEHEEMEWTVGGHKKMGAHHHSSLGRAVYEMVRVDKSGRTRRIFVKRRDILRANGLLPRDLRRIDPGVNLTRTSTSISVRNDNLIFNLGGARAIVSEDRALLFEPSSEATRSLLEIVVPRLQAHQSSRAMYTTSGSTDEDFETMRMPATQPFELEVLEASLILCCSRLEAELLAVTKRAATIVQSLPNAITPVNLEELRRVKQALVQLESRADSTRELLEDLMDDEDELREFNLSSRPKREERRKARERERIVRSAFRDASPPASEDGGSLSGSPSVPSGASSSSGSPTHNRPPSPTVSGDGEGNGFSYVRQGGFESRPHNADEFSPDSADFWTGGTPEDGREVDSTAQLEAADAWREMEDAEAEEAELEEVEDLLEYYVQRVATTQTEAERLLDGARDLEESIAVSLSARRLEVVRLELMLSIASFAAAVGAMIAGIFGMNLTSTLEASVVGFWGTTIGTVLLCLWIYFSILKYTRRKRILPGSG